MFACGVERNKCARWDCVVKRRRGRVVLWNESLSRRLEMKRSVRKDEVVTGMSWM